MKRFKTWMTAALAAVALVVGQEAQAQQSAGVPRVSLLTCAPGCEVYELEGHTALRLMKPGEYDVAVNWGLFDFNSPNFVWRFVLGETDYMAGAAPTSLFLDLYRDEGRRVTEQVLALPDSAALKLERLVAENLLPQNRTYRYNYVLDNCATRPLNMILKSWPYIELPEREHTSTFRREMRRFHRSYPWYQFGIDIALGEGIDREIDTYELAFAPVTLQGLLADATILTYEGRRPLVTETNILVPGAAEGIALPPTPWWRTPTAAALLLFAITLALTVRDIRRRRLTRWFDSLFYFALFFTGCIVAFLVFVSSHEATSPNLNLAWLNPLAIIPAVGVWIKKCKSVVYWYQICNFAVVFMLLGAAPFVEQWSGALILLMLCDLLRSLACIVQPYLPVADEIPQT